jgi:hypothetical protein
LLASLPIIIWKTVISSGEAIWANVAGILWCGGATKSLLPILPSAQLILCIIELIVFDEFLACEEITTFCIGHKVITSSDSVRASNAGVLKCSWATITLNMLTPIASCRPLFNEFKIVDVILASDIFPVICKWNKVFTGCHPI